MWRKFSRRSSTLFCITQALTKPISPLYSLPLSWNKQSNNNSSCNTISKIATSYCRWRHSGVRWWLEYCTSFPIVYGVATVRWADGFSRLNANNCQRIAWWITCWLLPRLKLQYKINIDLLVIIGLWLPSVIALIINTAKTGIVWRYFTIYQHVTLPSMSQTNSVKHCYADVYNTH